MDALKILVSYPVAPLELYALNISSLKENKEMRKECPSEQNFFQELFDKLF
jgi:hypothetical protein